MFDLLVILILDQYIISNISNTFTVHLLSTYCINKMTVFTVDLCYLSVYSRVAGDTLINCNHVCLSQGGSVGACSRYRRDRLHPAGDLVGSDHP